MRRPGIQPYPEVLENDGNAKELCMPLAKRCLPGATTLLLPRRDSYLQRSRPGVGNALHLPTNFGYF